MIIRTDQAMWPDPNILETHLGATLAKMPMLIQTNGGEVVVLPRLDEMKQMLPFRITLRHDIPHHFVVTPMHQ